MNPKQKKHKRILIGAIIFLCVLIVEAVIFMVFFQLSSTGNSDAVRTIKSVTETSLATEAITKAENESQSKKSTKPDFEKKPTTESMETVTESATDLKQSPTQPAELIMALETAGYTVSDLSAQQLIVVNSQGSSAYVSMYQKSDDGKWTDSGISCYGFVGQNGVDEKSMEGDYKTPFGLYSIGDAFYIDSPPKTNLGSFQVTSDTYWVDDPDSSYYNQRVEGTSNMDWNSAEHMISYYSSYKYGVVINYNTNPIVPGKGSAIFFHVGSSPTAGCVAVSESDLLNYLSRLDKNQNPHILII